MPPIPPRNSEDQPSTGGGLPRQAVLALTRLHPAAFGLGVGTVLGGWGLVATVWTLALGDPSLRRGLALLVQYMPGYRVNATGALLAMLYGMAAGFVAGFLFAATRNYLLAIYVRYVRRKAEQQHLSDVLDRLI